MHAKTIDHMFNFTYRKSSHEIIAKMETKILIVQAKIEDRVQRVAALRAEYGIDDAALVQLLTAARKQAGAMKFSYTSNSSVRGGASEMQERTIGAGAVNNLLTESDFIESERDQVTRMKLVVRNLQPIPAFAANGTPLPDTGFQLSDDEIEYLGF